MTLFLLTTPTLFSVTLTSSQYFPFYSWALADLPIMSTFRLKIFLSVLIGAGLGFVSLGLSCIEKDYMTGLRL